MNHMKHEESKCFSQNLIYLLEKNNMRKVDLAKNLGLSKSAISNYLSGTSIPKRDVLVRIASYFDVTAEELLKSSIDSEPKIAFKEADAFSFVISFFRKTLSYTDVIYRRDNFQSDFFSPIPVYKDMECYAVMAYDNLMKGFGIDKGSIAIFASTESVADGEIAAVLIKSEKKIVIRKVLYTDKHITLVSDSTEDKFKKTSKDCDAVVLGKIIHATFNPNK